MKRIFLIFYTLLLFSEKLAAQNDSVIKAKKWNHELGSNVYNLAIGGGDYYSNYKKNVTNCVFSGMYFKFYRSQNVIRASVDYLQRLIFNDNFFRAHSNSNLLSSKGIQVALGYQRLLSKRNTTFFVFTDLSYRHIRELRSSNSYLPYWDYYGNRLTQISSSTYSASPGIGLRIKLKKNIVLTLESAAQFFYSTETSNEVPRKNKIIGINIKPMNCCIGFKF